MAEVEPHSHIDALGEDKASEVPHGEHEDIDVEAELALDDAVARDDTRTGDIVNNDPNSTPVIDTLSEDTPAAALEIETTAHVEDKADDLGKTATSTNGKPPMAVKPPTGKINGGPPTPLVKRIINSGTFGSGSVKASASKPSVAPSSAAAKPAATPAATSLKKSTSVSSAPTLKPTMASSRPAASGLASSTSGGPPNRRASVVPAKPPATKPTSSASTIPKPGPTPAAAATNTARASVVSPVSNASVKSSSSARPRASVSEAVKRAPLSSRQSLGPSAKVPSSPAAKPTAPAIKPSRTATSISSIKEVREDLKSIEELQNKLKEANESLSLKADEAALLEVEVDKLKSSLDNALVDVEQTHAVTAQFKESKEAAEQELKELKESIEIIRAEHQAGGSALESLKQELEVTKAAANSHQELVQHLQAQVETLEAAVSEAKENMETLRASHDSASSDATVAVSVKHEALIKAQADLAAIKVETDALRAAHAQAFEEATQKLTDLESKAVRVETLEAELADHKADREETSGKLSELEIEVLELKESQEVMEDERNQSLTRLKTLEEELFKAAAATQEALLEVKAKEEEHARHLEDNKKLYGEELKTAAEEHAKIVASLEIIKTELIDAQAAHEQAKADANTAAEAHARQLAEAEQGYLSKQNELSEEIKRITAELEGQEAQYNAKVDAVKAEHNKLLEEAFERAKNEAGDLHAQDLQSLRVESQATLEQLRGIHQTAIDDLKAEHLATLESQVKSLEKQISNQGLELRATQDDLAKAKASLESARVDVERLTVERDEARAAAAAGPIDSPEHIAEVGRLTQELSHTKDDLSAITELLELTKASLVETSNNHLIELEEAAKGRAEEVTKLRETHDAEAKLYATQKADLLEKLSDLEGELTTLKATITAEPAALKSNGNGAAHPLSPGVTKEELQRMHEAHNLKVHDIQAEYDRIIKALKDDLESTTTKAETLQQDLARKMMEIQYLEQEQDENQDQITRLKSDLDSITEQLKREEDSTV